MVGTAAPKLKAMIILFLNLYALFLVLLIKENKLETGLFNSKITKRRDPTRIININPITLTGSTSLY